MMVNVFDALTESVSRNIEVQSEERVEQIASKFSFSSKSLLSMAGRGCKENILHEVSRNERLVKVRCYLNF